MIWKNKFQGIYITDDYRISYDTGRVIIEIKNSEYSPIYAVFFSASDLRLYRHALGQMISRVNSKHSDRGLYLHYKEFGWVFRYFYPRSGISMEYDEIKGEFNTVISGPGSPDRVSIEYDDIVGRYGLVSYTPNDFVALSKDLIAQITEILDKRELRHD